MVNLYGQDVLSEEKNPKSLKLMIFSVGHLNVSFNLFSLDITKNRLSQKYSKLPPEIKLIGLAYFYLRLIESLLIALLHEVFLSREDCQFRLLLLLFIHFWYNFSNKHKTK